MEAKRRGLSAPVAGFVRVRLQHVALSVWGREGSGDSFWLTHAACAFVFFPHCLPRSTSTPPSISLAHTRMRLALETSRLIFAPLARCCVDDSLMLLVWFSRSGEGQPACASSLSSSSVNWIGRYLVRERRAAGVFTMKIKCGLFQLGRSSGLFSVREKKAAMRPLLSASLRFRCAAWQALRLFVTSRRHYAYVLLQYYNSDENTCTY